MARPRPPEFEKVKTVAENRRARFEYFLEDFFEAGIALTGQVAGRIHEVKPVAQIFDETMAEYEATVARMARAA